MPPQTCSFAAPALCRADFSNKLNAAVDGSQPLELQAIPRISFHLLCNNFSYIYVYIYISSQIARPGTGKYPTILRKPEAKRIARTKPGIYKQNQGEMSPQGNHRNHPTLDCTDVAPWIVHGLHGNRKLEFNAFTSLRGWFISADEKRPEVLKL